MGASGDNDSGAGSGSAYIYRFDGISWIETKLLASDGATDDLFGLSVATSGDTVGQETKLLASDGASNDYFGRKVATHGDTVVVGASGDDDNVNDSGSAYIYRFDGISWIETKLLASDAIYYDLFGSSVAISGDKVVVGALGEYGLGSVYIFGATMLANDCNANGVPDECDIDDGTSNDVNGNSIPDECEVDCMMAQALTGMKMASQTNVKLIATPMAIQMITTSRWVGQKMSMEMVSLMNANVSQT